MKLWGTWCWPFGNARMNVQGRDFLLPRWLLRSLRNSHDLKQDLNKSLHLVHAWMANVEVATTDAQDEILLLCEMPLSTLKDDTKARLEDWMAVQQRGIHCRLMLADHISDLVSHLEYGPGKARKKPLRSREELLQVIRDLHEELVGLMQDLELKLREFSAATDQLRKLL